MTLPRLIEPGNRSLWLGLAVLALAQAGALVAAVAGTRLAFGGLETGAVPTLATGLIAGSALALAVLRPGVRLMAERLGQSQTAAIRSALYRQALAAGPDRQVKGRRGYLLLRLTGDMTTFKDGISRALPPVLQGMALIPAAVLALAMIDQRFGFAGFVLAALGLAAIAGTWPSLQQAHAALRNERARLVVAMAERVPIAPDLARLGRRQRELSRLDRANRSLRVRAGARLIRVEMTRALPGFVASLAAVAILTDGASRGLTAGEIAVALAAIGIIAHALVELATAADRLTAWRVARQNLARHMAAGASPPAAAQEGQIRVPRATGALTVEATGSGFNPVRLDLAPGDHVRLCAPDPGRALRSLSGQIRDPGVLVRLDGIALADLTPGSLRRCIGTLTPTPAILKGTVRRNICLGLTERPADRTLLKRIERAGLGPTLRALGGLDGRVPEAGPLDDPCFRLRLSALRSAVQRPQVLLVHASGLALPDDVLGYIESTSATVIMIHALREETEGEDGNRDCQSTG